MVVCDSKGFFGRRPEASALSPSGWLLPSMCDLLKLFSSWSFHSLAQNSQKNNRSRSVPQCQGLASVSPDFWEAGMDSEGLGASTRKGLFHPSR